MKKTITLFKLPFILLSAIISFVACEKDFSEIESDVLGLDNSNLAADTMDVSIIAYNKKLEGLQIDNLTANLLGFYKDPNFGKTTASIVTQITPTTFNPNFGTNPVIDSVVLRIPYYSRVIGTGSDGNPTYTIKDSVFGEDTNNTMKPIKLSVYENTYFLRDFNPFTNSTQKYYSNTNAITNSAKNGSSTIEFDNNTGELLKVIDEFVPSSKTIILAKTVDGKKTTERIAPALRLKLDPEFWKNTIIEKGGKPELSNANNFRNHFRGLYFKAEAISDQGSMIMLNMNSNDAHVTIYYSKDSTIEGKKTQDSYVLKFTGNKLNTFINDYNFALPTTPNNTNGDEKLYLKGIEGSMAVIDLFKNKTDLDAFKNNFRVSDGKGGYKLSKLINDVQLVVYEDESITEDIHKYDRIYAYDIKNNKPTVDYVNDPYENLQSPYHSKILSLGQRIKDANGYKYKIRLTEHIKNIILKDSTNTKIGLVLSTNVNYNTSADILDSTDDVTTVPAASVLTPRGTILYGNKVSDETKKMKLHVFFTETK